MSTYNAGPGGAQRGIDNFGDPDRYTTGGNYSARVFEEATQFHV